MMNKLFENNKIKTRHLTTTSKTKECQRQNEKIVQIVVGENYMSVSDVSNLNTKLRKCTYVENDAQRSSLCLLSKSIKSNVETLCTSQCASRRI